MAEIKIERSHGLGSAGAKKRIESMEPKLKEKYSVKLEWSGDTASLTGAGVTGTISVEPERLAVNLKLGLLLRPLAGKIREGMETQLDAALA
jgi:putative polyhydroxyalkanoate system protein